MSAHFKSYLESRYPDTASEFEVHVQTGGLVNHTVRARRGSQSFILKYAPPYIATVGETAPFSQERQAVEAASLKLFEQGPLSIIPTNNQIAIPKVLDHDRDGFILALEDLGQLDTLWDCLRSAPIAMDNETLNAKYADMGKRIGGFFAAMHLPSTLASIKDLISQKQEFRVLDQNLTRDLVLEGVLMPVLGRLQQPGGMEHDEALRLYNRVLEDFERPALPDENCFSMGDCHPGSVLLSKPGDGKVAIIDFEFATIKGGRGINSDMAQLLASLHVLLLSLRPGSPAYLATEAFVSALCKAYSENAWMSLGRNETDSDRASRMAIFRSSLILHGREVINHAIDLEWASEAMSVAEMVQVGVWYLERAGANVGDMMRADNWAELEAKEDRKIMLRLWGLC